MTMAGFEELLRMEITPEALEGSCDYLASHLQAFLQPQQPVLITFPNAGEGSLGTLFRHAVERCGAIPVTWDRDYRWKELLRLAFASHAKTIIGHPLVMLGLTKLCKATSTPIRARNVVLAGYPCSDWMAESIKKGLDCRIYSVYAVRALPIIAGFSCDREEGTHIRDDLFQAYAVDDAGYPVPDGVFGLLRLVYRKKPCIIYESEEVILLSHDVSNCGQEATSMIVSKYVGKNEPLKSMLADQYLNWASILDFRAERTDCGIHLEIVYFAGESLPKIHSCARLSMRPWNPNEDIPFCIQEVLPKNEKIDHKNLDFSDPLV